ncbi:MAG: hypothetical protein EXS31_02915 [Pedosphaera sp.]|nr:hypothetical protein [Pedosphaera sp.]
MSFSNLSQARSIFKVMGGFYALFGVLVITAVIEAADSSAHGATQPSRNPAWPRSTLKADASWQLNLPKGQGFDASALLITKEYGMLTVNDRGSTLYQIDFSRQTNSVNLLPLTNAFTARQLEPFKREKIGRYDTEGIAQDSNGRLYICEEANRWVLRWDPKSDTVERLVIDWAPVKKYFSPIDINASFEGIAVGGDRLYVANERQLGRIIVVDLKSLKVVDDFAVQAAGNEAHDVHYTDLSWFDGALYVLLRASRCVLKVDAANHRVLAEYSFLEMEQQPETRYILLYPTGNMEGLAVDKDYIWLVTDNNGQGRVKYPKDTRPTLFRCKRPDTAR